MDEAVKPCKRLCRLAVPMVLALLAGAAGAQAVQDPTRPPAGLMPARGAGAGGAASLLAPSVRMPRLQSVLIARQPGGRHVAVIDGQTVRLGDLVGGARVVRIAQTEVELRRGRTRQILKLNAPAAPASGGIERLRQE